MADVDEGVCSVEAVNKNRLTSVRWFGRRLHGMWGRMGKCLRLSRVSVHERPAFLMMLFE